MSLRRPPTRIELKSDDIEEYEQVRRASCVVAVVRREGKVANATHLKTLSLHLLTVYIPM